MSWSARDKMSQNHTVEFTVPTRPKPKQRAKKFFNQKTKTMHAWTPKETEDYESLIRWHYRDKSNHLFTGAIHLHLDFRFEPPKSMSKKKREQMIDQLESMTKKPDLDNLVKAIKDSLNGVAWTDDSLIVHTNSIKYYWEKDEVYIRISSLEGKVLNRESMGMSDF